MRLAWRLGRRSPRAFTEPPERPVGAKLEITYACNLRCGFCYTDSPRRTLQRTPEMSDEQWRAVVRESLDLGIIEAVITGGEPLLRREVTLEAAETLASAGVGVTLNTNGWFVDDDAAARLGELSGVTAHVSVDGARPGVHDTARGVPGSWRRAIEGVDRLLSAGVGVCVVHVVTPDNVEDMGDFLEQMWTLGVPWVRMTPVVEAGAAARGGKWRVSRRALQGAADDFRDRRGTAMRVNVQSATAGAIGLQGRIAPASYLVRPNGDVRPDSMHPFTFGNAAADGVEPCWRALRENWDDERIEHWAKAMNRTGDIPASDLVPYLDDEVAIAAGGDGQNGGGSPRTAQVPTPSPPKRADPAAELVDARETVLGLALARRYRAAPLRWAGSEGKRFVRLAGAASYLQLNESSGLVMDALDGGAPADAADALADRYGLESQRAREDAIAATQELVRHRVVLPAAARNALPAEPGTSDLPGLEPVG
jgi:MoaA/NifB/PqqE/SkfB family radical SAM enzyme